MNEKANPILVSFGQHLRELRQDANLTQEELGIQTDIDQKQISNMELGRVNISLLTMHKLAAALHISISELVNFPLK